MENEEFKTVMVVVAHPDDMEFSSAGTVAKFSKEGRKVILVQSTSGDKGTARRDISSEELASMRESEEREACKRVGVEDVVFLRMGDGELMPDLNFREKIVRQIRTYPPGHRHYSRPVPAIFTPSRPSSRGNHYRRFGLSDGA